MPPPASVQPVGLGRGFQYWVTIYIYPHSLKQSSKKQKLIGTFLLIRVFHSVSDFLLGCMWKAMCTFLDAHHIHCSYLFLITLSELILWRVSRHDELIWFYPGRSSRKFYIFIESENTIKETATLLSLLYPFSSLSTSKNSLASTQESGEKWCFLCFCMSLMFKVEEGHTSTLGDVWIRSVLMAFQEAGDA